MRNYCTGCKYKIESGRADNVNGKDLHPYSVYCICEKGFNGYPQFISRKSQWTGATPKWCPILPERQIWMAEELRDIEARR